MLLMASAEKFHCVMVVLPIEPVILECVDPREAFPCNFAQPSKAHPLSLVPSTSVRESPRLTAPCSKNQRSGVDPAGKHAYRLPVGAKHEHDGLAAIPRSMAEVRVSRTHRRPLRATIGFEDREDHRSPGTSCIEMRSETASLLSRYDLT